jgi:hypothetical protein
MYIEITTENWGILAAIGCQFRLILSDGEIFYLKAT